MVHGTEAIGQYFEDVQCTDSLARLRELAENAEREACGEASLSLVWEDLARGATRVVEGFFTRTRCVLVLVPSLGTQYLPLEGRRRRVVAATLSGQSYKSIAIDLGVGISTVAVHARLGLEALGVFTRPSRVHPLLILAASAASQKPVRRAASFARLRLGGTELQVLGVPRPDLCIASALPEAVMQAVRGLVEGRSYAELAATRGTSTRTIANQTSAVFRRLGVSGRNELIQYLLELDGAGHAAARLQRA